jgi:protein TonB
MRAWRFVSVLLPSLCLPVLAQTVDRPLQPGGDIVAPVLVYQVDPDFPESVRRRHVRGEVIIGIVVNEAGVPQSLHVVRSSDASFNEYVTNAVRKYRFRPATKSGTPVAVQMDVPVNFQVF